jgi:hypothetical protein
MKVGSTIAQSILLTSLWMVFVYAGNAFSEGEPPQTVIVPAGSLEIKPDGEIKELPESVVQSIQSGQGGSFMTKKALAKATEEYKRNQLLLAGLSVLSCIGAFVAGMKISGHWGYAVAALALGPVLVAYYFLYKANLPSAPTPNLPPS